MDDNSKTFHLYPLLIILFIFFQFSLLHQEDLQTWVIWMKALRITNSILFYTYLRNTYCDAVSSFDESFRSQAYAYEPGLIGT